MSIAEVLSPVLALLTDNDSEVRAQAARVLGDARHQPSANSLMRLLQDASERVRFFAALALGSLQHRDAVEPIVAMLRDNNGMAALRLLNSREFEELPKIIDVLLTSDNANLRAEARNLLAGRDEERTSALISQLLDDQVANMIEKQLAFATLARMKSPSAGQSLDEWAVRLRKGNVPLSLQLDLMDALTASPTESRQAAMNEFRASGDLSDPLTAFQVTLEGGNAEHGRELFVSHAVAQCIRCHTVNGRGGMAGPDLSAVAHPDRNIDRRYLLESMVLPNARIAKGFGTVTLVLDTGKLVAGTIKDEDATSVTLVTPSNETMRIARNTIDEQSATTSAMPAMTRALTLLDIRDITEYLSTLTTRSEPQ